MGSRFNQVILPLLCVLLYLVVFALDTAAQDNQSVESHLRSLYQAHLDGLGSENIEAAMKDMHPDSPSKKPGPMAILEQVFSIYDLKYSLDEFRVLSIDGDIAVSRVKQTMRRQNGPAFRDNQLDALQVYRKHEGQWKLFDRMAIDVEQLQPTSQPTTAPNQQESSTTKTREE